MVQEEMEVMEHQQLQEVAEEQLQMQVKLQI